jgi:hypothetical protein
MKARTRTLVVMALALGAGPALAHEVANMDHTHAFEQQGYGKYRVGHSVNNEYGSITIWSARTYNPYQGAPPVRFARPEPITQPPGNPLLQKKAGQNPTDEYGREAKPDYGD